MILRNLFALALPSSVASTQRLADPGSPSIHPLLAAFAIGISTLIATSGTSAAASAPDQRQLLVDVEYLNEIVERYDRAGGWFSENDSADRVMARLNYADGDFGVPLMKGSSKVTLLPIIADEIPKGQKWTYWNHNSKRFIVWQGKPPHGTDCIIGFKRSFRGTPRSVAKTKPSRPTPVLIGSKPKRSQPLDQPVEDLEPVVTISTAPPVPPVAVSPEDIATGWTGTARAREPRLASPSLLPEPGIHLPSDFPLSISAEIPRNSPDGAELTIWVNGDPYDPSSNGSITVNAGDEILAFVDADAVTGRSDSEPVGGRYDIPPIQLELSLEAPSSAIPAKALTVSGERTELFPTVTLKNFSSLPDNLRNDASFEIRWTIDGSDPSDSKTSFPVRFDAPAGQPHPLPMTLATLLGRPQDLGELKVRAIAVSKNKHVLTHSTEASMTVKVAP